MSLAGGGEPIRRSAWRGGAFSCGPRQIGFVLPKSTQPRSGGDRGPRVACPAETGFVPPKPPELRGGGDRGPGIAAWPRRGRDTRDGIERPDCGFPPRQRAPLVAVEPHQPGGEVASGGEAFDHDLLARAADAPNVDLRLGDAQRGSAAWLGRVLPGDPSRQVRGLGREARIGEHRLVQPVTQRVARAPLLAGARARPGTARRIGAVGGVESFIGAWCCGCEVSRALGPSPPLAGESRRGGSRLLGARGESPLPTLPRKRGRGIERRKRGRGRDVRAHLICARGGHAGSAPVSGTRVNSPASIGGTAARARSAARRLSIAWRAAARRTSAAASMRSMRSN